jgi:hypothetical protein
MMGGRESAKAKRVKMCRMLLLLLVLAAAILQKAAGRAQRGREQCTDYARRNTRPKSQNRSKRRR